MYEINKEQFGKFITELRKEKGMTQKELAEKLLVSSKAISKWETGANLPDITLLVPLADTLGITVTELLECKRNEQPQNQETEQVVRKAIQIANISEKKNPYTRWFVLSCIACAVELVVLKVWLHPDILNTLSILMCGTAFMGGYACFFMKDSLPAYYDENKIHYYSNGVVRMNLVGLSFNNRNWHYIVKVIRIWAICMLVSFPLTYTMVVTIFEKWLQIASVVWYVLSFGGLIVLMYYFGKKYE